MVVKIEGLLVPPPAGWMASLAGDPDGAFEGHELFPRWAGALGVSRPELRERLVELAADADWELEDPPREFLDTVYHHTPLRVAYLTTGPREWARGLADQLGLRERGDLVYHYDRYPYGTRRTLLQFLMNRFIAGRARTMLLGDHPADERLARREGARFRSPLPPPDGADEPEHWNRNYPRLLEELDHLRGTS